MTAVYKRPKLAHPPQMVRDWMRVAIRHVGACYGPDSAEVRGARESCEFLEQPAECWYGLARAPEDLSDIEVQP